MAEGVRLVVQDDDAGCDRLVSGPGGVSGHLDEQGVIQRPTCHGDRCHRSASVKTQPADVREHHVAYCLRQMAPSHATQLADAERVAAADPMDLRRLHGRPSIAQGPQELPRLLRVQRCQLQGGQRARRHVPGPPAPQAFVGHRLP